MDFNPVSLMDRIKQASDTAELNSLLSEGDRYQYASPKTRRRWEKAVDRRSKELADK